MDFGTFSAVLTVYRHNFKILHWGASGKKFDRIHKLADEYADMVTADLDVVAEMALRNGQTPCSMNNAIEILHNVDGNFLVMDFDNAIGYEEFCTNTSAMLASILNCINELHESELVNKPINMGIKSDLEAMFAKYDLQARYLNARRMDKSE